jgi:RHS repeat-associated protein
VKAEYVYDAWGNHVIVKNDDNIGSINPFRYRGYYFDIETGLYYLKARYYDPETGRFINADDIGVFDETRNDINGLNLYAYCANNPVMLHDPTGQIFGWIKKAVNAVGAVFKATNALFNMAVDWVVENHMAILAAVAIGLCVAAIVVGTVATGGLLGAVLVGAGIGGLSEGLSAEYLHI